ncbi:MAG: 30S ribosomal protein S8 [Candidatus Diapherotrites archaeon]|nr:30S ribosomal protein S8 [Candidatus Diapherotrites archaeon]
MVMNDPLANAMSVVRNASNVGKDACVLKPASKLLGSVLKALQKDGYIGEFEFVDDGKAGYYNVTLNRNINKCGVITPRHAVKKDEYTKFEKRFLPGQNIGMLIVSTPYGVMSQKEAIKRNTGGQLIAYVY